MTRRALGTWPYPGEGEGEGEGTILTSRRPRRSAGRQLGWGRRRAKHRRRGDGAMTTGEAAEAAAAEVAETVAEVAVAVAAVDRRGRARNRPSAAAGAW